MLGVTYVLPRIRLNFTMTTVLLFVFVSVVDWIGDQAALEIVVLFVVQPVLLILAIVGIRLNRLYSPRLRITWRKSVSGNHYGTHHPFLFHRTYGTPEL